MKRRLNRLQPLRLPDLLLAAVAGGLSPAISTPHRVIYYGYARQALADAFRVCGCAPGDTVLYPDFICDVTIEAATRCGLRVAYYPVTDALEPDWDVLGSLIASTGAAAVMSVNYFGFPQPMARWEDLAHDTGVAWINDNAHGYGSLADGVPLDAYGHVSITSMRKVLPLLNGAALRINRPDLAMTAPTAVKISLFPNDEELRRVARSLLWAVGRSPRQPKEAPYARQPASAETEARDRPMDPLSRRILHRYDRDLQGLARQRRRLYAAWHQRCTEGNLRPVFVELPGETSPMVYPCYAVGFEESQAWQRWAAAADVDVYPWPSLPVACRRDDAPALRRWCRLLCFPIHPFMAPEDIRNRRP